MYTQDNSEHDYLLEFQSTMVRASRGKRFANYLIDIVFFYIGIFVIAYVVASASPGFFSSDPNSFGLQLMALSIYFLLYFIVEAVFNGKTLGKLITGTRAVNIDGSYISPRQAFNRSISRIVPFEALSAFGTPSNPWHDRWSDTMVIDEKRSGALSH